MANKYAEHSRSYNLRKRIHGGKCIRKKPFPSEEEAQAFASSKGFNQIAYKCHFCPCWHLKSN